MDARTAFERKKSPESAPAATDRPPLWEEVWFRRGAVALLVLWIVACITLVAKLVG